MDTQTAPAAKPADAALVEADPLSRLSLNIPLSLHRRIKAACALSGISITDAVTPLLKDKWPE